MSGIVLTTPIQLGSDSSVDIAFIGINYQQSRVIVQLTGGSQRSYVIGPGGIESIASLVAAVPNFAGLRVAMLQHIQSLDSSLAGVVT